MRGTGVAVSTFVAGSTGFDGLFIIKPDGKMYIQSGVGNVANAVLAGLDDSEFTDLVAYTEVLQDGMLDLLDSGTLRAASATSFGLSSDGVRRFMEGIDGYKGRILLRSQEISNHPEVVRRLGVLAMNGMIKRITATSQTAGLLNSGHASNVARAVAGCLVS